MTKVYQKIIDKDKGDCMRAVIASMFDKDLEDVPYFFGDKWFSQLYKFIEENGYSYHGTIHNKKETMLWTIKDDLFKEWEWHNKSLIMPKSLSKLKGVNGMFFASVYSPNYYSYTAERKVTHAVVIDKDYNIIHDPNPENKDLLSYPLSNLIGYNGIVNVYLIEPNTK
jgi:hypothetical protein